MDDYEKALEKIEAEDRKLADQKAENDKKREAVLAEAAKKVIADIQAKVKKFNITPEQIFGAIKVAKPKKSKKSANKPEFLYVNEAGEGWTGGRGATPKWVKAIKDAGGDVEKYRIKK